MGEGVGHDIALRLLLQAVVADRRSSLQSLIDIAWIEEVMLLLSTVRPHAGKAIRLQLDAHLELVHLRFARCGLLRLHHARENAELVLHVMTDFVRNHISLRELAGVAVRSAAELVPKIIKERCVEIDALIAWAVERPHSRAGKGAGRRLRARKQA